MTGQLYSAADAEHFGLVNSVVPEDRALEWSGPLRSDRRAKLD
jgi:enoyl-CoA hydratase/carnithine racemase